MDMHLSIFRSYLTCFIPFSIRTPAHRIDTIEVAELFAGDSAVTLLSMHGAGLAEQTPCFRRW
jgi:hypothetical protein